MRLLGNVLGLLIAVCLAIAVGSLAVLAAIAAVHALVQQLHPIGS